MSVTDFASQEYNIGTVHAFNIFLTVTLGFSNELRSNAAPVGHYGSVKPKSEVYEDFGEDFLTQYLKIYLETEDFFISFANGLISKMRTLAREILDSNPLYHSAVSSYQSVISEEVPSDEEVLSDDEIYERTEIMRAEIEETYNRRIGSYRRSFQESIESGDVRRTKENLPDRRFDRGKELYARYLEISQQYDEGRVSIDTFIQKSKKTREINKKIREAHSHRVNYAEGMIQSILYRAYDRACHDTIYTLSDETVSDFENEIKDDIINKVSIGELIVASLSQKTQERRIRAGLEPTPSFYAIHTTIEGVEASIDLEVRP